MGEVHRADVLVRWIGLLPFSRTPADQDPPVSDPDAHANGADARPWQAGRRRPAGETETAGDPDSAPRAVGRDPRPEPEPGPGPAPLSAPAPPRLRRAYARPLVPRPPVPPPPRRRGAIVDGIEHRPPVDAEFDRVGLSRRLSGRRGSRLLALFFIGVYLLILVQLLVVLMNH